MCGNFGFVSPSTTERQLKEATDQLILRGPDAAGYFYRQPIGLGHRRLSIIDLSTGEQPMFDNDRSLALVFNGEIYNYKSIRQDLLQSGCVFSTKSDTVTIR
jgi:asparagine synthase (glutamine-hydrolysing)